MARRVTLEVVLIIVITIVLAWLLLGVVSMFDSTDPPAAFTDGAPRMLFGVSAIALVLWAIMVTIGSIAHRNRGFGWRIATHLVSLFVAILVNVIVFVALAFVNSNEGGWGLLLAGIALGVGLVVAVAGTISVLLVELVILRPKQRVEAGTAALETSE
jgi:hypothetical protein